MIGYGIDVSHHQDPAKLPWDEFRGKVDFVIARAAYGENLDRCAVEHVSRARDIGAKVGLYIFFRNIRPLDAQFSALEQIADEIALGPGDIVPTIDVEEDPIPSMRVVNPTWNLIVKDFADRITEKWGNALIYITQHNWHLLGSPAWVLDKPMWVAHYTTNAAPATPGNRLATIWQHRVGPFDPTGPGGEIDPNGIDQDRLLMPLPLIGGLTDADRAQAQGIVAETLADTDPAPPDPKDA